jgi:hypothetical protein
MQKLGIFDHSDVQYYEEYGTILTYFLVHDRNLHLASLYFCPSSDIDVGADSFIY